MNEFLTLGRRILPEAMSLLQRRFDILSTLAGDELLGRRQLAAKTGYSERIVRQEVDFLNRENLLDILPRGIRLTKEGQETLNHLRLWLHELLELEDLSEKVRQRCAFEDVLIVPGDADEDEKTLSEIGRLAARELFSCLRTDSVVALTGGNSIKAMVEAAPRRKEWPGVTIVPARGGVGPRYNIQSNTLAGRLADALGAVGRILNLPDSISEKALNAMLREAEVAQTVRLIRRADIVVAGVGDAITMARRRGLTEEGIEELKKAGALGEFFGCYYDAKGCIVSQSASVGLSLEDVARARKVWSSRGR